MRLFWKLVIGALAVLIVAAGVLISIVVSVFNADMEEAEKNGTTASRDGQGFWYWLMVGIDKTVGLPEPKPHFPDQALVAATFLKLLEGGEATMAHDLTSVPFQQKTSVEALESQNAHTIKRLGSRDPLKGPRKWNTAQGGDDGTVKFSYYRNHERGSSATRVTVRKYGSQFLVDAWVVEFRHFRMKR